MPDERGAYATYNGIKLWYRDEGNKDGEPLLLIMGLSSQLIHWPEDFVQDLGGRGYRVIRFDNRDCGLSDKFPGLAYLLFDMAADAVGVLDYLEIDQAHIVGASMGGMIAQLVAIHHKPKVRSLCSIMSTTGAKLVGWPTFQAAAAVIAPTPPTREDAIPHIANVMKVIGSETYEESERAGRLALAEASYDRMFYPEGGLRQAIAISLALNRTPDLSQLTVPTLVVHSAEDSLINISGGKATHAAVVDSQYLPLDAMGHDLPKPLRAQIAAAIDTNAKRAV